MSHHILDIVDSVSIMAYRDRALDQIDVSRSEVEYAKTVGKKAYIGAETKPSDGDSIPDSITYFHKQINYMNEQLKMIEDHYSNHPGFGGITIHEFKIFQRNAES